MCHVHYSWNVHVVISIRSDLLFSGWKLLRALDGNERLNINIMFYRFVFFLTLTRFFLNRFLLRSQTSICFLTKCLYHFHWLSLFEPLSLLRRVWPQFAILTLQHSPPPPTLTLNPSCLLAILTLNPTQASLKGWAASLIHELSEPFHAIHIHFPPLPPRQQPTLMTEVHPHSIDAALCVCCLLMQAEGGRVVFPQHVLFVLK